jgi:hypothetical protein
MRYPTRAYQSDQPSPIRLHLCLYSGSITGSNFTVITVSRDDCFFLDAGRHISTLSGLMFRIQSLEFSSCAGSCELPGWRWVEMGTFMQLCVSHETHNCMNVTPTPIRNYSTQCAWESNYESTPCGIRFCCGLECTTE